MGLFRVCRQRIRSLPDLPARAETKKNRISTARGRADRTIRQGFLQVSPGPDCRLLCRRSCEFRPGSPRLARRFSCFWRFGSDEMPATAIRPDDKLLGIGEKIRPTGRKPGRGRGTCQESSAFNHTMPSSTPHRRQPRRLLRSRRDCRQEEDARP